MTVSSEYERYVELMNDLFAELKMSKGLDLELHPFWPKIILDQRSNNIGYKVHQINDQADRIMSLAVNPLLFDCLADGSKQLSSIAKGRITQAFTTFWSAGNTDRHVFVEIL